jgi:hypothetical protein
VLTVYLGLRQDCYDPTVTKLMVSSNDVQTLADRAQARTGSPEFLDSPWRNRRAAFLTVVAVILCIYSYPALRTAFTTRSLRLPAVSAPDLGLYLSISKLEKSGDGAILNPYYRIPVPYSASYLKFRWGPTCFGLLNNSFGGRIWLTLFVWNLLWWFLLCMASIWLLDRFLPLPAVELVLAGLSLLTVFSFEGVWRAIAALIHSSATWPPGGLPYIRPFTPQIIVPLWLCYVGLQMRALSGKRLHAWGMMAFLQFVAFAVFPYATLMMAGTTAVAAFWYIFAGPRQSAWRLVLCFFLVCALPDIAFALYGSGGSRLSFPDQTSLIRFQPSLVSPTIGKMWLVIATLLVATVMTRKLRPEVKWPLVGLGLTNILLALGNAFVSERVFFLGNHITYFYESTIFVLFLFLASAYIPSGAQSLRLTRIVSLTTVLLCCAYGFLTAEYNYRFYLPYNLQQADLASWFGRGEVSTHDLVITQFASAATGVPAHYDDCEWIPLLSKAEVLYCRNAQLTLPPEQNRDVQRLREVLYLYFDGKDHQWLENTTQFEIYGLYGEVSSYHRSEERTARIFALRHEMLPLFDRVEHSDPSIQAFFRRFRRVWILQNRQNSAFVNTRLGSYLDLKEQELAGNLLVMSADPK